MRQAGVPALLGAQLSLLGFLYLTATCLRPVQMGQSNIEPLGKGEISLRWADEENWRSNEFMILPDSYFDDQH